MGLEAGDADRRRPVNVVFVGSCTNGRLSDLRDAARVLRGRKVAQGVQMLVVPGLAAGQDAPPKPKACDQVFLDAGAEWRESRLLDVPRHERRSRAGTGQYSVSTSNRNFEGRQGEGARTLLASPLTAAARAVRGRVTDPRELLHS